MKEREIRAKISVLARPACNYRITRRHSGGIDHPEHGPILAS
jgi:hypothetical protein